MIIAFTGHRPHMFPGKYNENHYWVNSVKRDLLKWLKQKSPSLIISGGAQGMDTWAGKAAIKIGIPFDLYVPFPGQGDNWPDHAKEDLNILKEKSRNIILCSETYHKRCFFIRDEKMIDDCDEVASLLKPGVTKGGTFYTVNYAKKLNKPIQNFWKDE